MGRQVDEIPERAGRGGWGRFRGARAPRRTPRSGHAVDQRSRRAELYAALGSVTRSYRPLLAQIGLTYPAVPGDARALARRRAVGQRHRRPRVPSRPRPEPPARTDGSGRTAHPARGRPPTAAWCGSGWPRRGATAKMWCCSTSSSRPARPTRGSRCAPRCRAPTRTLDCLCSPPSWTSTSWWRRCTPRRCASHTGASASPSVRTHPERRLWARSRFTAAHLRALGDEAGPGWSVDLHEHHGGWVVFDRLPYSTPEDQP